MKNKCKVYIGNRDTGKTTKLYNEYLWAATNGKRVLVIDSATDHEKKSLIVRLKGERPDSVWITSCSETDIIYPEVCEGMYPIIESKEDSIQLYLCDASFYLEKGYDYPTGKKREECRMLYKRFSMQVLAAYLNQVDVIIMDEIELIKESRWILEKALLENKHVFMALHKEDCLEEMKDLIVVERLRA